MTPTRALFFNITNMWMTRCEKESQRTRLDFTLKKMINEECLCGNVTDQYMEEVNGDGEVLAIRIIFCFREITLSYGLTKTPEGVRISVRQLLD